MYELSGARSRKSDDSKDLLIAGSPTTATRKGGESGRQQVKQVVKEPPHWPGGRQGGDQKGWLNESGI